MTERKKVKTQNIFIIIGCALLLFMGVFHGIGIHYVTEIVNQSNTKTFIKKIFPVLFGHASLHLFGMATLGLVTLGNAGQLKRLRYVLVGLISIDALLAFYLGAALPGFVALVAALCFLVPTWIK